MPENRSVLAHFAVGAFRQTLLAARDAELAKARADALRKIGYAAWHRPFDRHLHVYWIDVHRDRRHRLHTAYHRRQLARRRRNRR